MSHNENEQRSDWAEIVSRRRALKANCGIYARRHGPGLLAVLSGSAGIRARYIGQLSWFELEDGWRETDARRIGELAAEIVRFGRDRGPEIAEVCAWHAARLRELVRQHAVLHRLESERRSAPSWPHSPSRRPSSRRKSGMAGHRF